MYSIVHLPQAANRSWKQYYVMLSDTQLHFYKDRKDVQQVKGGATLLPVT